MVASVRKQWQQPTLVFYIFFFQEEKMGQGDRRQPEYLIIFVINMWFVFICHYRSPGNFNFHYRNLLAAKGEERTKYTQESQFFNSWSCSCPCISISIPLLCTSLPRQPELCRKLWHFLRVNQAKLLWKVQISWSLKIKDPLWMMDTACCGGAVSHPCKMCQHDLIWIWLSPCDLKKAKVERGIYVSSQQ